jgi:NAD(P)-dependent dehydrogenase (short-subunit alcohol dehydrogenase family)
MSRSVVITGASTGIGRACALHLDQQGFRVFAGVRKTEDGIALAAQASPNLTPVRLDVADAGSLQAACEQITASLDGSGLDGLVNNAGIAVVGPLEFLPLDEFRRQMEVNLTGALAVTQTFLPLLRKSSGRIVFVSSISGRVASPLLGPYAISKFAMEALADTLRRELYPWELKVAVIQPGRIETPIWEKSLSAAEELVARMPAEAGAFYGGELEQRRRNALPVEGAPRGTPVEAVSQAIEHALVSPRPKTRYLVGRDARLGALAARFLPDAWLDRLLALRGR